MSEERDDRLLDAALGGRKPEGLSPDEAREAARLRAAFASLAAGTNPVPPPAAVKELLMARIGADIRRRRAGTWAMAASVFLLAGAAFLFRKSAPWVRVEGLAGEVTSGGRRLAPGDLLPPGAALTTAPGAWARLSVSSSRAALLLKENAALTFSRLRGSVELRLDRGGLLSRVRPGTKFSVFTPAAVAAVRGTTFYVQAEAPDRTYICLCQGRLQVTAHGVVRDLQAEHHTAVRAAGGALADAGMEGHTDEDAAPLVLP